MPYEKISFVCSILELLYSEASLCKKVKPEEARMNAYFDLVRKHIGIIFFHFSFKGEKETVFFT